MALCELDLGALLLIKSESHVLSDILQGAHVDVEQAIVLFLQDTDYIPSQGSFEDKPLVELLLVMVIIVVDLV
jgi:hypothetical protein